MSYSTDTFTQSLIDYVTANPGVSRAQIIEGTGFDGDPLYVSTMLGRLKRTNALRSEGPYPKLNRWYPVETTDDEKYQEMARTLLEELKSVHHATRQDYLANRLKEIIES